LPSIIKYARVPYGAAEMFTLVADVAGYPDFLPWCSAATVHSQTETHQLATLEVSKGPVRKRFTTRNGLLPPGAITLELADGPFSRLHGRWQFEPLAGQGCKVSLALDFELKNALLKSTLGPVFGVIANTMVDAFCRRATQVYGPRAG